MGCTSLAAGRGTAGGRSSPPRPGGRGGRAGDGFDEGEPAAPAGRPDTVRVRRAKSVGGWCSLRHATPTPPKKETEMCTRMLNTTHATQKNVRTYDDDHQIGLAQNANEIGTREWNTGRNWGTPWPP